MLKLGNMIVQIPILEKGFLCKLQSYLPTGSSPVCFFQLKSGGGSPATSHLNRTVSPGSAMISSGTTRNVGVAIRSNDNMISWIMKGTNLIQAFMFSNDKGGGGGWWSMGLQPQCLGQLGNVRQRLRYSHFHIMHFKRGPDNLVNVI